LPAEPFLLFSGRSAGLFSAFLGWIGYRLGNCAREKQQGCSHPAVFSVPLLFPVDATWRSCSGWLNAWRGTQTVVWNPTARDLAVKKSEPSTQGERTQ